MSLLWPLMSVPIQHIGYPFWNFFIGYSFHSIWTKFHGFAKFFTYVWHFCFEHSKLNWIDTISYTRNSWPLIEFLPNKKQSIIYLIIVVECSNFCNSFETIFLNAKNIYFQGVTKDDILTLFGIGYINDFSTSVGNAR